MNKKWLFGITFLLLCSLLLIGLGWFMVSGGLSEEAGEIFFDTEKEPVTKGAEVDIGKRIQEQANPRGKNQGTTKPIFEKFQLTDSELEIFYERRYEPREVTLSISGLRIDKRVFQVEAEQELPLRLKIPLPEGGEKEFIRSHVDFGNKNSFVWVGTSTDDPLETVHLSSHKLFIVGSVETPQGSYEIKHLSGDKNIIRKINRSQFPREMDDVVSYNAKGVTRDDSSFSSGADIDEGGRLALNNGVVVVDIIIGYSNLIESAEGGASATIALLNLAVSVANTTHRNSNTRVVLYVTNRVKLNVNSSQYDSQTQMLQEMNWASMAHDSSNFIYDESNPYHVLMRRRARTKADVVALFTEKYSVSCGRASILKLGVTSAEFKHYAMNVNAANCQISTLSHEIGHNLGAEHNAENVGSNPTSLPYARGFRSESAQVLTVMSYPCNANGCSDYGFEVFYFSNPTRILRNTNIGRANQADNSRAIRERVSLIQNIFQGTNDNRSFVPNSSRNLPSITQQPLGGNVPAGGSLTLRVGAASNSGGALKYKWYRNEQVSAGTTGVFLYGENRSTLVLTPQSYTGASSYFVRVFNNNGVVSSSVVNVNFPRSASITITRQPQGGSFDNSGYVTLHVLATANTGGPVGYQWFRREGTGAAEKETFLYNETHSRLKLTAWNHPMSSAVYFVRVSNNNSTVYSNPVTVRSNAGGVTITEQPRRGTVPVRGTLTLRVRATASSGTVKYQWYANSMAINGATSSNLVLRPSSQRGSSARYYAEVFTMADRSDKVQSNTVTVNFDRPMLISRPTITEQPRRGTVPVRGTLTLRVRATASSGTVKYQWYANSMAINGATSSNLVLRPSSQRGSSARYYAEVFTMADRSDKVQSNTVTVQFSRTAPTISIVRHPEPLSLRLNDPAEFSIEVTGGHPPLTVKWYKDGSLIRGANSRTLSLGGATWVHRGSYFAEISDSDGTVQTQVVQLNIADENRWKKFFDELGSTGGRSPSSSGEELGPINRDLGIN